MQLRGARRGPKLGVIAYLGKICHSKRKFKMTKSSTTGNSIRIAFKAKKGKYVTSNSDGNVLQASSDTIGSNENFQMYLQGEDKVVSLMASNGKYVSNQQDGAAPLAAIADAISPGELFTVEDWDPKIVVLYASNKKYIQLVGPTAALQAQGDIADAGYGRRGYGRVGPI